ncbi:MAG: hypothetical protein E7501_05625 [Ruminococcus sp.]|nr:hypothetical protein [Ruminococcus sp.]MBQ8906311.1 hypothetical protein [Ruminococcus sp.]
MNQPNQIPKEKLDPLLQTVSKKLGIPPEQLRSELEQGKFDSALSKMNPNDASKLKQAISNPKLVEKLMSSQQAQALYQKLTGTKP